MSTIDNSVKSKKPRLIIALLAVAVLIAVLSSIPAVQTQIKSFFSRDERVVLAKINTYYGSPATEFLILKIKDSFGVQIEIYEIKSSDSQPVYRQKFEFTQDSDAYITLDKSSSNLALSDVDKDGQLDIIAPSVDRNGNLRLNTFRFNPDLNSFEPYAKP